MSAPEYGIAVTLKNNKWQITLPHKCGQWGIVPNTHDPNYEPGVMLDEAIAGLETFIAEANQALNALRDRQEYNPDHDYD